MVACLERQPEPSAARPAEAWAAPAVVQEVLRSPGAPLDPRDRAALEPRFGHDFSRVRVHADARAAGSARAVQARAYTVGQDVVFGEGQYAPGTAAGRRLLAHELAHSVQQGAGGASLQARLEVGPVDDPHERAADRMADAALAGHRVPAAAAAPPRLRRKGKEAAPAEPWVDDRDGSLYYKTRKEAERRMAELEAEGQWGELRVSSFERKGATYWRVQARKPKAAPKPPKKGDGPGKETAPKEVAPKETPPKEAPPPSKEQPAEAGTKEGGKKGDGKAVGKAKGGKVCMTYDDGPQPGTKDVLDVHDRQGVPATFFLTGANMDTKAQRPEQKALVERMIQSGHRIANHTYSHHPENEPGYQSAYGDLSDPAKAKAFEENFSKNEEHFRKLLGSKSPVFRLARLPGQGRFIKGKGGKPVYVEATEKMGLKHVGWDFEFATNRAFGHIKADDWQGIKGVGSETNALPRAGSVILLHDRHWNGKAGQLEAVITLLKKEDYTFGQLDDSGKCK
jgi:peptidoglycan/xylan/chitin deacetylase (PgdA/CDA1 family)